MTILQRLGLSRQSEALWRPPDWKDANAIKAVSGPGVYAYANDYPLSNWSNDPLQRAARNLKAYKVGWFYKAESKISRDIALLDVSVSPEDTEGDNEAEIVEPDLMTPFEQLDPMGQFLRLMERPNPNYTGRQLRQKTQIRIDMAGWAFWYLEGGDAGLPSAIYGISPTRLWPSTDGGQLIGWVMDKDKPGGGIPFSVEEILPFTTANSDDEEWYGVGVVDAVAAEMPLTEMMARHTADVLTTGGRLAGMIWPKDRALGPDEYVDAQRAWRNVASDPNAARRMLIFPEPMEYAAGASTPAEIGIPELAALNRDNILTAFPISPYQLGVPMPGGLNSADIRREDRRDYWEGTIHPRVELLEDAIQVGLLSRYEEVVGGSWDFDIAEPNLDDASTLIEKVGAMKALISQGFDDKASVDAVGLDHIKYNGPPAPPPMPVIAPPAPEGSVGVGNVANPPAQANEPIKATKAEVEDLRDRTAERSVPVGRVLLTRFFKEQKLRVTDGIRRTMPTAKAERMKADPTWWDSTKEDAELREVMRGLYVEVGRGGLQAVADILGRVITRQSVDPIVVDLLEHGGERIKGINDVTQQAVQDTVSEGVRRGYSLNQIIEGVPDESYSGVTNVTLDNGALAFDELRAETIARTETMLSYNRAAVLGYDQFGVQRLLAYDGDMDAECAARNGNDYPIDEALGMDDHPNGTLVWSPVVDKAWHGETTRDRYYGPESIKVDVGSPVINMHWPEYKAGDVHVTTPEVIVPAPVVNVATPAPVIDVHVPEQPQPDVLFAKGAFQVAAPEVTVEAPSVTVEAPFVNVEAARPPDVQVDVHVPEAKPMKRSVVRDKTGKITGIEES